MTETLPIRINLERYCKGAMLDGSITITKRKSKEDINKKIMEVYNIILEKLCPPID